MTSPKVSVIIPTYNRWPVLAKSLSFLRNQTFKDFEVIIVDDASGRKAPKLEPNIRYFRLEKRSGSPAARNFGANHANGKYLLFLDDDIILSRYYLEELLHLIEADEKISAAAGRLIYVKDGVFSVSSKIFNVPVKIAKFSGDILGSFDRKTSAVVKVPTLHIAALIRKRDFYLIGGFDSETYFGNFFREETDLFFRLAKIGKKLCFDPHVAAYHVEAGMGGQRSNIVFYEFYVLMNHVRFLRKFFGRRWLIMGFFFVFRRFYERLKQLFYLTLRKMGLINLVHLTPNLV
jgi:GT2 family glycosyltransferase